MQRIRSRTGHGAGKASTVDVKSLFPSCTTQPFASLEYLATDPLNNNMPSITLWTGRSWDECESHFELVIQQARQKRFEIPGIPLHFVIVNGEIYYRRLGLEG